MGDIFLPKAGTGLKSNTKLKLKLVRNFHVPLQVFALEMARERGHDVDQPRNLAKSVTVE